MSQNLRQSPTQDPLETVYAEAAAGDTFMPTVVTTYATMKQVRSGMFLVFMCQLLGPCSLAVQAQDIRPDGEYAFGRPTYHNGPYKIWSRSGSISRKAEIATKR